jgi:hypothetical protein
MSVYMGAVVSGTLTPILVKVASLLHPANVNNAARVRLASSERGVAFGLAGA